MAFLQPMNLGEYKEEIGRIPFGKRVHNALYVHREGLADIGGSLGAVLDHVVGKYQISTEFADLAEAAERLGSAKRALRRTETQFLGSLRALRARGLAAYGRELRGRRRVDRNSRGDKERIRL